MIKCCTAKANLRKKYQETHTCRKLGAVSCNKNYYKLEQVDCKWRQNLNRRDKSSCNMTTTQLPGEEESGGREVNGAGKVDYVDDWGVKEASCSVSLCK